MNLRLNILIIFILIIFSSGLGTGSLVLMANDPNVFGHVAFGFQKDDGTFAVYSFCHDEINIFEGKFEIAFPSDLSGVKNYLSASNYKTFKVINVDNPNPTAAEDMLYALQGSFFWGPESGFSAGGNSENCLTVAIKVLRAYGADMPGIIPFYTIWPNFYYNELSNYGWEESSLSASTPTQTGIETPHISQQTSDTLIHEGPEGSDISDIGSLTGQEMSTEQETSSSDKAPTEAQFPDLPCV